MDGYLGAAVSRRVGMAVLELEMAHYEERRGLITYGIVE
jgi:hypothetical protein